VPGVAWTRPQQAIERAHGAGHRPHPRVPVGDAIARPGGHALGEPTTGSAPCRVRAPPHAIRPGITGRQTVHEPCRPASSDRTRDPIGSGPAASLINRRRKTRKDHRLHRLDPQPEGSGGEVHLRRHRGKKGSDWWPRREH